MGFDRLPLPRTGVWRSASSGSTGALFCAMIPRVPAGRRADPANRWSGGANRPPAACVCRCCYTVCIFRGDHVARVHRGQVACSSSWHCSCVLGAEAPMQPTRRGAVGLRLSAATLAWRRRGGATSAAEAPGAIRRFLEVASRPPTLALRRAAAEGRGARRSHFWRISRGGTGSLTDDGESGSSTRPSARKRNAP